MANDRKEGRIWTLWYVCLVKVGEGGLKLLNFIQIERWALGIRRKGGSDSKRKTLKGLPAPGLVNGLQKTAPRATGISFKKTEGGKKKAKRRKN